MEVIYLFELTTLGLLTERWKTHSILVHSVCTLLYFLALNFSTLDYLLLLNL